MLFIVRFVPLFVLCLLNVHCQEEDLSFAIRQRAIRQTNPLPSILSAPENLSIPQGRSVVLRCQVKDLGPFVVLWNRNRIEILYAGSYKVSRNPRLALINNDLYITNVTYADAGRYSCQIASHPPREVTHRLSVVEAAPETTTVIRTEEPTTPTQATTVATTEIWERSAATTTPSKSGTRITTLAQEFTAYEGESVTLPCLVEPETVQAFWKRQETVIFVGSTQYLPDFRLRVSKDVRKGNATLTIRNLRVSDTGRYTCGTLDDEEAKIEHRLLVLRFRPVPLEVVNFEEGSHAHLNCKSTTASSNPKPSSVYWRKQGSQISTNAKSNKHLLIIDNISTKDAGDYECQDGNGTLKAFKVNVLFKPKISMKKTSNDPRKVEILCSVDSKPSASIKWIKTTTDGKTEVVVHKRSNGSQEASLLMELEDSSSYMCVAENTLGTSRHRIDAQSPPRNVQVSGEGSSSLDHDYRLSWSAESMSEIKAFRVRYRRHNSNKPSVEVKVVPKSLQNAPLYVESLLLTGLKPGMYSVIVEAENQFGVSTNEEPFLFVVGGHSELLTTNLNTVYV